MDLKQIVLENDMIEAFNYIFVNLLKEHISKFSFTKQLNEGNLPSCGKLVNFSPVLNMNDIEKLDPQNEGQIKEFSKALINLLHSKNKLEKHTKVKNGSLSFDKLNSQDKKTMQIIDNHNIDSNKCLKEITDMLAFGKANSNNSKDDCDITVDNPEVRKIIHSMIVSLWNKSFKDVIQNPNGTAKEKLSTLYKNFAQGMEVLKKEIDSGKEITAI